MTLSPAPYHSEIAYGPEGGAAHWVQSSDGLNLRIGHWPLEDAKGTVLIFPGRTEFIEKYGQTAAAFAKRGLASAAIDWRGQGLSDRMLDNPLIGHVERFTDYQKDAAAMIAYAQSLKLPRPYFLLAHSMGGAIGLRAVMETTNFDAVAFSGPMWGLQIAPHLRPFAWTLSHLMPVVKQGHRLPPSTRMDHHVIADSFEGNLLTRDAEQFGIMRQQLTQYPELTLGGPSYVWLREALREMHHLASRASPHLPAVTILGTNERIVELSAIHARMESWKGGHLEIVPEGEHEVLMESHAQTAPLFDQMAQLFLRARGS